MTSEQEGRELAETTRARFELGLAPIADMAELLEQVVGADVVVLRLPHGHDGMTRRNPDADDIVVGVNVAHAPERQRFTLAHELGHIVADDLHDSLSTVHDQGPSEKRANAFARHFLAPLEGVRRQMERGQGLELVSDVVRLYGVSPAVALIQVRAHGVDLTNAVGDRSAAWFATRFGWDSERAGQVARAKLARPPRSIVAGATAAYEAGAIDNATLARIRKDQISSLQTLLEDAGIERGAPAVTRSDFEVGDEDW